MCFVPFEIVNENVVAEASGIYLLLPIASDISGNIKKIIIFME